VRQSCRIWFTFATAPKPAVKRRACRKIRALEVAERLGRSHEIVERTAVDSTSFFKGLGQFLSSTSGQ
jgi:hypothetical protein